MQWSIHIYTELFLLQRFRFCQLTDIERVRIFFCFCTVYTSGEEAYRAACMLQDSDSETCYLKAETLETKNLTIGLYLYTTTRGDALEDYSNKKAELSQRRPPNIWVPWQISRVLTTLTATFPEICNGLLFRSILRMCVQNLKFVALPVPEIIGRHWKNFGSPYAHAPFSPNFLKGFCSDGPCECRGQIESW